MLACRLCLIHIKTFHQRTYLGTSANQKRHYLKSYNNKNNPPVFCTRINHFPFSGHDIIITKLKTEDINRGMWIMNHETIKSEQFRHAFKILWDNWKIEKNNTVIYGNGGILHNVFLFVSIGVFHF